MEITLKAGAPGISHGFSRRPISLILTRYTLREIVVPAALALVVIGFVGVANEIRERRGALPIEFITWWDAARLAAYLSPTLISYVIPITYMMGILLAFGRLAQNNEITAMKAAGIPLKRLVVPVLIAGGLLSGFCFYLQDRVQPAAVQKMNHLLYTELPERITLEVLPTGVMRDVAGWRIYIGSRDAATKTLNDVVILQPQSGGNWVYYAESARFIETDQGLQMFMNHGNLVIPQEGDTVNSMRFADMTLTLPQSATKTPPGLRRTQTLQQLWGREAEAVATFKKTPMRQTEEDLRRIRQEICERITLPLACLAVSLLAAPLAVRAPRAGRTYSFALGFAIIGGYYVLRMLLQPSSIKPMSEMLALAFVPNLVLCVTGIVALWRVDRV